MEREKWAQGGKERGGRQGTGFPGHPVACVCVCGGPGLYLTLPEDDGTLSLDLFLTASTHLQADHHVNDLRVLRRVQVSSDTSALPLQFASWYGTRAIQLGVSVSRSTSIFQVIQVIG